MKTKLTIMGVLTLLLIFITSTVQASNELYVAPDGFDTTNCQDDLNPCATIGYAIGQAADGDIINVAAGTYINPFTINKEVTLLGPNAGVAGYAARAAEAIIENAQINVTGAGPVVIDGFHIYQTNDTTDAILLGGGSVVTVRNNIIEREGVTTGVFARGLTTSAGSGAKLIKANLFTGDPSGGLFGGHVSWNSGVYINGASSTVALEDNRFENTRTAMNLDDFGAGMSVVGNVFDNNGTHISFGGTTATDGQFTLGANEFGAPASAFVNLSNVAATFRLDITASTFGGDSAATLDLADQFLIEYGMYHRGRSGRNGLVTYVANTQFVIPVNPGIQSAVNMAGTGHTIFVAEGTYTENVAIDKALNLRGSAGGGFDTPVMTAPTAAPGVWYTDRYAPGVFDSFDFGGEMVLRHGVREADSADNRPPGFSGAFYNTQGRKLDLNLTGNQQSMSIDLWLDASMAGPDGRVAGLWGTGYNASDAVSSYPIVAFRNRAQDPGFPQITPGFYGWDLVGNYVLLKAATPADYNQWHTLSIVWTVGTGVEYFVNGEPLLAIPQTTTAYLGNVILNAYNFAADYDVYWDNFKVGSETPATYESVVTGRMTISASDVEVTGFYLTNPGQTNAILIDGMPKPNNILIANNRIQDVGSPTLESHVHTIYLNRGPDNVTIANNVFSNLKSGTTRSVSAIGVLDSASGDPSEGLVIANNSFTDIASAGRGAYGVIINNAAGAPGAQIVDNAFANFSGLWTHAVGMEGPTANAVVTGNSFSDLTATGIDKSAVFFEDNPFGNTVTVAANLFNGPSFYGVAIHPDDLVGGGNGFDYEVVATNNWWGSPCGPSAAGVDVGPQVVFSPWWGDPNGNSIVDGDILGDLVIPVGASSELANAILACAPPNSTVDFEDDGVFDGGIVVTTPGLTINLNGGTVGAGSPAFTIASADVTILGPGTLTGNNMDPGILVVAGGDNFTLKDVEVRNWADGVEVAANVTSFKLFDNWIHSNADAGLQVNSGVTLGGVVSIQGNLFKVNGVGIRHEGTGTLPAEYNSWGHLTAPVAPADFIGLVDADPWTFAEVYMDVDPPGEAIQRDVNEGDIFDVALKVEAANLYGLSFVFSYDDDLLTYDGLTFSSPWAGTCVPIVGLAANEIGYQCGLTSGPEWNGGTVATFSFTADLPNIAANDDGPWSALFDISHEVADTSAGAIGGAKVFVNNAGFNDPSVSARDITDNNDGQIDITGLGNFTGFINLQGRTNDSGALIQIINQEEIAGATVLAEGTSAASGAYTTVYSGTNQLYVGQTYYIQINRPLFLPTTIVATAGTMPDIALDWEHSAILLLRPLTSLNNVLLLGGDATNSNYIDITDAGCIGFNYGSTTPDVCGTDGTSDVNEDGIVNILDLTLMGGNFQKNSSPWTP